MSVDGGGRVAFDGLRLKHRGSSGASRASSPVYRPVFAAGTCNVMLATLLLGAPGRPQRQRVPDRVPPKRSSQIHDGFGVNTPMPREPYLPWGRRWWTRIFDAGIKFARIGQYENSSDYTSWDWVEQKRESTLFHKKSTITSARWRTMVWRSSCSFCMETECTPRRPGGCRIQSCPL